MKAARGKVIVEQEIKAETVTPSGVVIPAVTASPFIGTVISGGDPAILEREVRPVQVSEGDRIMYDAYGTEFLDGTRRLMIINDCDILAIL